MQYTIRELRDSTGLSQSDFSKQYGIPLSTLRKWEQGQSRPPQYVIRLLANAIPGRREGLRKIQGSEGNLFYYNDTKKTVMDAVGNEIAFEEPMEGVKERNLGLYLEDLFDGLYEIQDRFNRDLKYDKIEDIIWTR